MTIRLHPRPTTESRTWLRALALLAMAPAAFAGTPIKEHAVADATGKVEVSNTVGSVVVMAWPRNEIEVTGTLGAGAERSSFRAWTS